MRPNRATLGTLMLASFFGLCGTARAQQDDFGLIDGSIIFVDDESDSRCAAVNTFNADFYIRSCDRRMVLLSGQDRLTPFTVDENYNVFRDDGVPAGRVRFATDNANNRQVFWLSDENFPEGTDFVLNYVADTDQLSVASVAGQDGQEIFLAPINLRNTQCDPLATYDGGSEVLCPRTLPGALCGINTAGAMLAVMLGLSGIKLRRSFLSKRQGV